MKKLLTALCVLAMSVGSFTAALPEGIQKSDFGIFNINRVYADTNNGYSYSVLSDGTAEITNYSGSAAFLEIPSEIDGKTVTSIGDQAFQNNSALTSVTIPSGVTRIKASAFRNCTGLTEIVIPAGITSIGYYAFSNCIRLDSISIPDNVTKIGDRAFWNCKSLTDIILPSGVKSIGYGLFFDCNGLKHVTLPSGLKSVEYEMFSGCTSLSSIKIPSGVTNIGSNAFFGCTSLTSISIPSSVTNIGFGAFLNCTGLKHVTIPVAVTHIGEFAFGYAYDEDYDEKKVNDFKIYCYAGTVGETYAKERGIDYSISKSLTGMIAKLSVTSYAYTGATKKPTVSIKAGTKTLKSSTDFTVTYKNNTAVGKATVTVKGKGSYTGTKTLTFKINPKRTTLSSVTAGVKKATLKYAKVSRASGYIIYRATSKTGTYSKLKSTTATSFTNTGLTKGKTYYYKIRTYQIVSGVKYYSAYSVIKSAKAK
ncbi:MAG: leucine-rich repeat domain-containing protein [Oscillospiraceae bacterium]